MVEDDVDEDQDGQTEQKIFPGGKKTGNSFEICFHLFLICIFLDHSQKKNIYEKN